MSGGRKKICGRQSFPYPNGFQEQLRFSGLVASVLTTKQPHQGHHGATNITFTLVQMMFKITFKFIVNEIL